MGRSVGWGSGMPSDGTGGEGVCLRTPALRAATFVRWGEPAVPARPAATRVPIAIAATQAHDDRAGIAAGCGGAVRTTAGWRLVHMPNVSAPNQKRLVRSNGFAPSER